MFGFLEQLNQILFVGEVFVQHRADTVLAISVSVLSKQGHHIINKFVGIAILTPCFFQGFLCRNCLLNYRRSIVIGKTNKVSASPQPITFIIFEFVLNTIFISEVIIDSLNYRNLPTKSLHSKSITITILIVISA